MTPCVRHSSLRRCARRWCSRSCNSSSEQVLERVSFHKALSADDAVTFNFDEADSEATVTYAPPRDGQQAEIRCATLTKLVAYLTNHECLEPHFAQQFLLTYRSFTTPMLLLELLKARFDVPVLKSLRIKGASHGPFLIWQARFDVPTPHNLSPLELEMWEKTIVRTIRIKQLRHVLAAMLCYAMLAAGAPHPAARAQRARARFEPALSCSRACCLLTRRV